MALGLGWRQECARSHRPACSYWQTGPLRGSGTAPPTPRSWVLPRPAGYSCHPGGAAMRRRAAQNRICAKQKFSEILHIYAKFPNLAKCWAQLHKVCAGAWLHSPWVPCATAPSYRGAGPLRLAPQPPAPLAYSQRTKGSCYTPPPRLRHSPKAGRSNGQALRRYRAGPAAAPMLQHHAPQHGAPATTAAQRHHAHSQ